MDDDCLWVFISSAMALQKDRKVAIKAVQAGGDLFNVWSWEGNAFPGRYGPDELYIEKAGQADILILLIGNTLTTNTRREYDVSVRLHKMQMVLFRQGAKLDQKTAAFKRRLRRTTYFEYRSTSELRSLLLRGLRKIAVRYARLGIRTSVGTRVNYASLGVK